VRAATSQPTILGQASNGFPTQPEAAVNDRPDIPEPSGIRTPGVDAPTRTDGSHADATVGNTRTYAPSPSPAAAPGDPSAESREPGELAPGTLVGKYTVIAKIGRGGMGYVYRALNPDLKCEVALKVIRSGSLAGPDEIRRFTLEFEALARFRHPNIVAVYDADQFDGQPFLVMELLPRGGLDRHRVRFQADMRMAVTLMEKVARAVDLLHQGGILHRDLKPANVLLDEHGEPRVSDFGLIKLLDADDELTRTGQGLGTPPHMAPEQTGLVDTPLGPATDVWALGVMLYELLLGRRPFAGANTAALFQQIATAEPARPRRLRRGFDAELEAVVLKCLQRDPAKRFANAGAVADDLARWLRGEPTETRPEGTLQRVRRSVRRYPVATLVLLTALVATIAALVTRHFTDPDRALAALQAAIGRGEPVQVIGENGPPLWSRWRVRETGNAVVAHDGYFTMDAMDEVAMLDLARELPISTYRVRTWVRHNKTVHDGLAGIYVGARSASGAGQTAHLFFALRYDGITDVVGRIPKLPEFDLVLPPGNPVTLETFLHVARERAPPWAEDFGGVGGVHIKPTGHGVDEWRKLEIAVGENSLRASINGVPLKAFRFDVYHGILERGLAAVSAGDPVERQLVDSLPRQFDPQGSLGLYIAQSSVSFSDFTITPITEQGVEP
jgi:eukaryotic-like serine/threonine-protein kinase